MEALGGRYRPLYVRIKIPPLGVRRGSPKPDEDVSKLGDSIGGVCIPPRPPPPVENDRKSPFDTEEDLAACSLAQLSARFRAASAESFSISGSRGVKVEFLRWLKDKEDDRDGGFELFKPGVPTPPPGAAPAPGKEK